MMLRVRGARAAVTRRGSMACSRNRMSPPYPPLPSHWARPNTRSNPSSSARTVHSALYSKLHEVLRVQVEGLQAVGLREVGRGAHTGHAVPPALPEHGGRGHRTRPALPWGGLQ